MNDDRRAMREEFYRWCLTEGAQAEQQLDRFKSGMIRVGVSSSEGYKDTSEAMMEHLERIIENMKQLADKVRADLEQVDPD